jgi:hypothetical protein
MMTPVDSFAWLMTLLVSLRGCCFAAVAIIRCVGDRFQPIAPKDR